MLQEEMPIMFDDEFMNDMLLNPDAYDIGDNNNPQIHAEDEYDAWGFLVCLLEEVSHLGGSHADEHLHELGTGH